MELPRGTVTFLFTDLEGSTRRWEAHPAEMRDGLARHNAIVHGAVRSHGGVVFSTMGDGRDRKTANRNASAASDRSPPGPHQLAAGSGKGAHRTVRPQCGSFSANARVTAPPV